MIEEIVQKNVPFVGVYKRNGFDGKSRINLPNELTTILKKRQKTKNNGGITLFYRLHLDEGKKHIELTDYLEADFSKYNLINGIDDQNRIIIPKSKIGESGIEKSRQVIFEGNGNTILIYQDKYQ